MEHQNDDPLHFWLNTSLEKYPLKADETFGSSSNIRVKQTITYCVCGIILRGPEDDPEILMIQETTGEWYLPAGRMEAGETIESAMIREVKEEAGVECESLGLIAVENCVSTWYRFCYLARHSGGKPKTLAERDEESLQALWIRASLLMDQSYCAKMPLRCSDIKRLITLAVSLYSDAARSVVRPRCARTIERPQMGLFTRFIFICQNKVLFCGNHFPVVEYRLIYRLAWIINEFLQTITGATLKTMECKVVCLEALPVPAYEHDGFVLTIFIELPTGSINPNPKESNYRWVEITSVSDLQTCIEIWRKNCAVLYTYD